MTNCYSISVLVYGHALCKFVVDIQVPAPMTDDSGTVSVLFLGGEMP